MSYCEISDIASLIRFVPDCLISHIENVLSTQDSAEASSVFYEGACLIVDITGFTRISGI